MGMKKGGGVGEEVNTRHHLTTWQGARVGWLRVKGKEEGIGVSQGAGGKADALGMWGGKGSEPHTLPCVTPFPLPLCPTW